MQVKVGTVIKNYTGEAFKNMDKDLTVKDVLAQTLSTVKSENPIQSYSLATKIYQAVDEVELTPEEFVFIKSKLSEAPFFPYIVGMVQEMFNEIK